MMGSTRFLHSSALSVIFCFQFFFSTIVAQQSSSSFFRAEQSALFVDAPLQMSAANRLECGARCLAAADAACVAFAFSSAHGVCGIGSRLNWTAGAGGWLGQTLFVRRTGTLSAASAATSATTSAATSATTSAATSATTSAAATTTTKTPTTTPRPAPYMAFWGGGGRNFNDGRAQCRSLGYADLISYDDRMGGAPMPNEFNITADLFKDYDQFSVYLMGLRYNTTESKFNWVSGFGSFNPSLHAWESAVNSSLHCVAVDRAPPYRMRSVDCASPVEAVICEFT